MGEILSTAGELVQQAAGGMPAVFETVQTAGGVVASTAGKIALGVLIKPKIERLVERLREAQSSGEVADDFESTPRGAKLLQEALNAFLDGKTEDQAEAVLKVFLGLAKSEPRDTVDEIEQLQILEAVAQLSPWELQTINLAERYRIEFRDEKMAAKYAASDKPSDQEALRAQMARDTSLPTFHRWIQSHDWYDKSRFLAIRNAAESLSRNGVLLGVNQQENDTKRYAKVLPHGLFNDFGWKIVTHLYAAT